MIIKKKQIPVWYKIFIEKRIKNLKAALKTRDIAEAYLDTGYLHLAIKYRDKAIKQAK